MSGSILGRQPTEPGLWMAYGATPQQFGHLRLPSGTGAVPCAIVIHGGFWRNRYDLEHTGHLCAALAAAGVATWNIEYRRVGDPGGGWPGTFQDVARAARTLFAMAAEHRIDPERVIVIGHSAGGQLASWLASLDRVPPGSSIRSEPMPLRGAVSLAGVLDLRRAWDLNLSNGAVEDVLGGSPTAVPERYAAASPLALLPSAVPHLVIHGEHDDIVPVSISERFVAAARARGTPADLYRLPQTGHFDVIDPEARAWPEVLTAILFLIAV